MTQFSPRQDSPSPLPHCSALVWDFIPALLVLPMPTPACLLEAVHLGEDGGEIPFLPCVTFAYFYRKNDTEQICAFQFG